MNNNIDLQYSQAGFQTIAGADEAGRGAWAGPLIAAAVIMKDYTLPRINDSKQLSVRQREELFPKIIASVHCGVIVSLTPQEIDIHGVHQANLKALAMAVSELSITPDIALIDGFAIQHDTIRTERIINGDQKSYAIAAASIIAKVMRDRLMQYIDKYDGRYEFGKHKGYGTALHQLRLKQFGPSILHRYSYTPIQRLRSKIK